MSRTEVVTCQLGRHVIKTRNVIGAVMSLRLVMSLVRFDPSINRIVTVNSRLLLVKLSVVQSFSGS